MASIRIVVVDDHELARRGIRSVLAGDPDLQVVAEFPNGEEAVQHVKELRPDILLLDISLPGMSGIEVARAVRASTPDTNIVFVSQHDSILLAKDALHAGARGYVVKSDAGRDLLAAIATVRKGEPFVSRTLIARGWTS